VQQQRGSSAAAAQHALTEVQGRPMTQLQQNKYFFIFT
jgi:hypothetical protein